MRLNYIIPGLILVCSMGLFAQTDTYSNAFNELFFGRQPSARSEAMGRAQVAVGGEVSSSYYNPALLGCFKQLAGTGSHASPFYADMEGKYDYYGVALPLGKIGVIGISRYNYLRAPQKSDAVDIYKKQHALYTISYSRMFIWDIALGMNVNLFRRDWIYDDSEVHNNAYPFDVGIAKRLNVSGHQLTFGASVCNVNRVKAGPVTNLNDPLPAILRVGASYERELAGGAKPWLGLLVTVEAQDVLNSEYWSAWRIGTEWTLFQWLDLRIGYYRETLDSFGDESLKDALSQFTYGLGFSAPVKELVKDAPDWVIRLDAARMPQPNFKNYEIDWEAFTVYSIGIEIR
ncbi:hypothetical protein KAR48_01160 [bacterium]|nr:hypothetical protein [bacterium]